MFIFLLTMTSMNFPQKIHEGIFSTLTYFKLFVKFFLQMLHVLTHVQGSLWKSSEQMCGYFRVCELSSFLLSH